MAWSWDHSRFGEPLPASRLDPRVGAPDGGSPLTRPMARWGVGTWPQPGRAGRTLDTLTPREMEVLNHVARGFHTKEIAAALGVSACTINSHLRNIYQKLQVHSRAAAAARFVERP